VYESGVSWIPFSTPTIHHQENENG